MGASAAMEGGEEEEEAMEEGEEPDEEPGEEVEALSSQTSLPS